MKFLNKHKATILALLLIVAVVGLVFLGYSYMETKERLELVTNSQNEMSDQEIKALLDKVGENILLPSAEEPAIATVFDAAALAETQAFFKDAMDGDKVLLYSDKAIIFRESEGLIINVGPVITDNTEVMPEEGMEEGVVEENEEFVDYEEAIPVEEIELEAEITEEVSGENETEFVSEENVEAETGELAE